MSFIEKLIVGVSLFVVLLLAAAALVAPSREAAIYNKFKDPDAPAATYWDAFWADLRVTTK